MPDNLLPLTERGIEQAKEAGRRVESILSGRTKSMLDVRPDENSNRSERGVYLNSSHSGKLFDSRSEIGFGNGTGTTTDSFHPLRTKNRRVHFVLSPFERTLQTARAMRTAFEHRIVRTDIESRIREQEFGNVQTEAFQLQRQEQQKIGRFWYRFATGESGADVYDRVKSWWFESVLNVNTRIGYEPIDAMVVVTHGLTMRFVLMQLFSWSPTTFHSVWNASNCDIYGKFSVSYAGLKNIMHLKG
jgi:broad specificity phosphatase PhoE